jgi:hypothetical protein
VNTSISQFRALPVLSLLLACACATPRGSTSPAVTPPRSAPHADGQSVRPDAAALTDLRGEWVEYWAVRGKADTEGYSFSEDGRFVWRAAEQGKAPNTAIHKDGTYRVEAKGRGPHLVLSVESERFAPCAAPCTQGGEPREVRHATPLTEAYELDTCPDNPEARELDADYTCRAIGGKTFWRKG